VFDKSASNEEFCLTHPLLRTHLEAVLLHNQKKNLTSITDYSAGEVLHIEDSLAVLPEIHEAPTGSMADLGSGAGYPGIPLALVSGRQTTLIESNQKKAQFLESFISANGLVGKIVVSPCRSEELALSQAESFTVVTARAVAELPALLELAAPLLSLGGHFVALKGRPSPEELLRGCQAAEKLGMYQLKRRDYLLKNDTNNAQRCVLVYQKQNKTLLSLPRRPGKATKRPLA